MKQRGSKALIVSSALITYTERSLRDLVRDYSSSGTKSSDPSSNAELRIQQRELLELIVALLPSEKAALPINFLCCLLRSAIYLQASSTIVSQVSTNNWGIYFFSSI
jgi:hypothetical protein